MNRKDLVDALIMANADITIQNKLSQTALDLAIEEGCHDSILTLLTNTQGNSYHVTYFNETKFYSAELLSWFTKIQLQQYVSLFVRENIFRDVLHLVDEKILTDMGIAKAGDRMVLSIH
jgi:ankyrin repeat protein